MFGSILFRSYTPKFECYIRSRVALKQIKAYNAKLTKFYKIINKCNNTKNKHLPHGSHKKIDLCNVWISPPKVG